MLIEKGSLPLEYKGKSLLEIHFDTDIEYADECDEGETLNTNFFEIIWLDLVPLYLFEFYRRKHTTNYYRRTFDFI